MATPNPPNDYVTVADLEIDVVRPVTAGFVLEGRGTDSAEYSLEINLDMPIDRRTRTIVGEILSQSECRLRRRAPKRLRARRRAPERTPSS
jgi:hypothetical protein